jgi:hypothetical protein
MRRPIGNSTPGALDFDLWRISDVEMLELFRALELGARSGSAPARPHVWRPKRK